MHGNNEACPLLHHEQRCAAQGHQYSQSACQSPGSHHYLLRLGYSHLYNALSRVCSNRHRLEFAVVGTVDEHCPTSTSSTSPADSATTTHQKVFIAPLFFMTWLLTRERRLLPGAGSLLLCCTTCTLGPKCSAHDNQRTAAEYMTRVSTALKS